MSLPETLDAMLSGPGRLRFILQPLVAIALGIRDGRLDAAAGRAAYVVSILFDPEKRREELASGLATLTRPLFIAILVDMVLQYIIFRSVHIWMAVLVGTVLIALPYVAARGISNRILQRRRTDRDSR